MKQYTNDYTLIQEAMDALYSATRLHANECYHDALQRINKVRTLLTQYLSQDNMTEDDDVYDGWCKASEVRDEITKLKDEIERLTSIPSVTVKFADPGAGTKKVEKHKQIDSRYLKQQTEGADPSNPLYEKVVVESGTYEQIGMSRDDVAAAIQRLGAKLNRDVSAKMNIFVTGNKPGPSKMQKVMKWRSEGIDIEIIDQMRLKEIIDKYLR